jgi:hypothetical protein
VVSDWAGDFAKGPTKKAANSNAMWIRFMIAASMKNREGEAPAAL